MSQGTFELEPPLVATDHQTPGKKVVISFADRPDYIAGRRSWVKYREMGVTQAAAGDVRAQVLIAEAAGNETTHWHLHRCEMQFLYVTSGALHLAFSPDHVFRLEAGDSIMIPGGTVHMELGAKEGVEVLEVTIPAEIGTETVANPWGDAEIDFSTFRRGRD